MIKATIDSTDSEVAFRRTRSRAVDEKLILMKCHGNKF